MMMFFRKAVLTLFCTSLMGCLFSSSALALDNLVEDFTLFGAAIDANSHAETRLTTKLLKIESPSDNAAGTIGYTLGSAQKVILSVYDQQGREVMPLVDCTQTSGSHCVSWGGGHKDDKTISAGTYFLMMKTDESVILRRLVLE